MEPQTPADAIAELLNGMNKGQYLILATAIEQLGGELRIDWEAFSAAALQPPRPMSVDADDGPVVLRLKAGD